ncbi:MAG TPA: hypothetical protein PKE64_31175 [Anaerolineae bacterium]|nr:hypothetical protein [Anaerolineae bacterium]
MKAKQRVLVVDDEVGIRQVVELYLTRQLPPAKAWGLATEP